MNDVTVNKLYGAGYFESICVLCPYVTSYSFADMNKVRNVLKKSLEVAPPYVFVYHSAVQFCSSVAPSLKVGSRLANFTVRRICVYASYISSLTRRHGTESRRGKHVDEVCRSAICAIIKDRGKKVKSSGGLNTNISKTAGYGKDDGGTGNY